MHLEWPGSKHRDLYPFISVGYRTKILFRALASSLSCLIWAYARYPHTFKWFLSAACLFYISIGVFSSIAMDGHLLMRYAAVVTATLQKHLGNPALSSMQLICTSRWSKVQVVEERCPPSLTTHSRKSKGSKTRDLNKASSTKKAWTIYLWRINTSPNSALKLWEKGWREFLKVIPRGSSSWRRRRNP